MLGLDPLTIGTLLTLAATPVADFCKAPAPAEINVIPATLEVKYDYSQSLADLQSRDTDTINPYSFSGVSHTRGYMSGGISIQPRVKLNYKHYPKYNAVCLWYEKIDVSFEIDPTIVIAKEVYEDPCMGEAVREHELKHVMADRRIVNKYAAQIGRKVYEGLKQRGFVAGPVKAEDGQHVAERMQKTVGQIIEHESRKMEIDRAEAQQAIDSLEEYERVSALCPEFNEKIREKALEATRKRHR